MEAVKKSKPKHLNVATWALIRKWAEAGERFSELSRRFDVVPCTIRKRALKEGWKIDKWEREKAAAVAASENKAQKVQVSGGLETLSYQSSESEETEEIPENQSLTPYAAFYSAMESAAHASPEDMQNAFTRVAQAALAAGVRDVPPPRNVKELATWFDLFRKASGLDAKDKGSRDASLVAPLRTLSRRSVSEVVEAIEVPELTGLE